MKIAKYQRIGSPDWLVVLELRSDGTDPLPDTYVRISEVVDVEFQPRPAEQVIPAHLAALDAKEKAIRGEFLAKLNAIADERAKLLCLTQESAA